jgi:arginyl-tRNA synthetase
VRAGLQALGIGIPKGYPDYVLHSLVKVMRGGAEVKISKRAGSYVTVRDLIDWVGRDAVRFFLVSRKADTEFVFDVDLAREKSMENPVYYVQYAHARVCSVFAQLPAVDLGAAALDKLVNEKELQLARRLEEFPEMLAVAAQELAPHSVAFYLRELAAAFHSYYNAERILVEDEALRIARLALCAAVRQTLANGLAILGVSAPEKMVNPEKM